MWSSWVLKAPEPDHSGEILVLVIESQIVHCSLPHALTLHGDLEKLPHPALTPLPSLCRADPSPSCSLLMHAHLWLETSPRHSEALLSCPAQRYLLTIREQEIGVNGVYA